MPLRLHGSIARLLRGYTHRDCVTPNFRQIQIPASAPWLAEYLHEMTVFPNGKHNDQVDSTAQFLDWFKKPFPGQGIFEYYREMAEKLKPPKPVYVRLEAPPGIGSVQTFSGRRITIGEDRIVEMSTEDADCMIRARCPKLSA